VSDPVGPRSSETPIDWEAIERSKEFQELVARKRRFVVPATIFFLGWYTAFVLLAGYAEDFMGKSISGGFTVGYALALTQFLMVWVLTWMYLRKARNEFDPLEEAAVEHLREQADTDRLRRDREATGRFRSTDAGATSATTAESSREVRR
jgi:uncharacterized membrane protein (DUF485 family)